MKGYRYDKEGHLKSPDPNEKGPHVNYWDYTKGKKGKGGKKGAVPLANLGATLFGADSLGADVVDFFNPLNDLQEALDFIDESNDPKGCK